MHLRQSGDTSLIALGGGVRYCEAVTEARREIRNPMTGERIVITASGLETSGCLLAFDV
ncbi:MAG: hypothetical protein JOZ81_29435, partial [Chloroflexi bacterium]|nr:hypothetical protein [Chloroflexota bacterium]